MGDFHKTLNVLVCAALIIIGVINVPVAVLEKSTTKLAVFSFVFFAGIYLMNIALRK